ncbi:cyclic nucleotide-binding domain-containing protein [Limibacillus halophilus]|jgi:CRP/FNR family cyclic AMP-dependent transcriptional regulator
MSLDQEVDALRKVPLFSNIEPARLKLMAFASERLVFKEGERLFEQGDPGDAAYIILEGSADVLVKSDGHEIRVATLKNNEIVGEIAILCDVPRTASVAAAEKLVTLKLTKDLFLRMAREFPDMALEIMRVLAHRLEQSTGSLRRVQQELDNLKKEA